MRTIGDKFFQDGDKSQPGLLKLTVLFHDIGKPSAQAPTGGPISGVCYHHTVESAAMANEICRRLRFSRRQTDYIEFIIRNQLRPLHLFRARQKKVPIQKVFIRFCMKCGDFTPDILLHALAGLSAKRVSDNQSIQDFTEFVQKLIQEYYRVLRPRASLPLPLNGMDLINEFGLKPSALFRRILKHVEEERPERAAPTTESASRLRGPLPERSRRPAGTRTRWSPPGVLCQ